MTPVFCCGFECGQSAASGVGHIGQHWELFGTTPNITFDTAIKRNGARSMKFDNLGLGRAARPGLSVVGSTVIVIRMYVYFTAISGVASMSLIRCSDGADAQLWRLTLDTAGNIFGEISGGGSTSSYTVTLDRWYQIDFRVTCNNNPHTVDVKVDGNTLTQATGAIAATTISNLRVPYGNTGCTTVGYIDDFIFSHTTGDYPIGAGYINHFIPTSDGTHNVAGTADFRRTLTVTDILNSTTDAYQLIDDVPLESGASVDWINMILPPNATDYVECIFGPASDILTPRYGPRAVEVIAGIHQAGTGTGNMVLLLRDNATSGTIYTATTVAGTTTVIYKRAHFATPPSGGSWGVAAGNGNFNNLRVRFGSPAAVDANPDQYFDCIMIEAEFAEAPQKIVQVKQAIKRASYY